MKPKISLHTHSIYLEHDTGEHPEQPARIEVIRRALGEDNALPEKIEHHLTSPAADDSILACHSREHLELLKRVDGTSGRIDADTIYSPHSIEAARHGAGGAIAAVDRVLDGKSRAAFNLARPPGHHATGNRAMGFCFINHVAVAARHARSRGLERVLIVDFDVHHGNGTQDIFYEDPSVFFYSLHLHPHYPGTGAARETGRGKGEGFTLNRPLPMGYPREDYLELYARDLDEIAKTFRPELALISAGFDSHRQDPLGGLTLESEDFRQLTREVVSRWPGRVVSTLEGGYNLSVLGEAARQHVLGFFED